MSQKEKGRPAGGDPIPNSVCQDDAELKLQLQLASLLLGPSFRTQCADGRSDRASPVREMWR